MTGQREVADHIRDLPRELLPQILHDREERATRLALEVEELHQGDSALPAVVEDMRALPHHLRGCVTAPR